MTQNTRGSGGYSNSRGELWDENSRVILIKGKDGKVLYQKEPKKPGEENWPFGANI